MATRGVVTTPTRPHHIRQAGEGDAGHGAGAEKIAPADPLPGLLLQDRFHRLAGGHRFSGDAEGVDQLLEQRGVRHIRAPGVRRWIRR